MSVICYDNRGRRIAEFELPPETVTVQWGVKVEVGPDTAEHDHCMVVPEVIEDVT